MARADGVESLLEQQAECDIERNDERDGGRERAVELGLRLPGSLPVEVVARQRRARRELPRGLGDGDRGEARWRHQRLLRAGDDDVEPPVVGLERDGAEARDRVHDDERAGGLGGGRERLQVADDARRRLRMDEEDERDRLELGEPARELGGGRRLAPLEAQLLDLAAVAPGHRRPALSELAGRDGEHAVAGRAEVDDRRLEGAGARAGEEEDVRARPVNLLQPAERPFVDDPEVRRSVMQNRLREGGEHLRRHGRRPGREQVPLLRHRSGA